MSSNPRVAYQLPSQRPKLSPPQGKPLIVHMVTNVEHWQFDQPMPRVIMTPPQGRTNIPDVPNFSWHEYGNRRGMPRLLKVLNDRKLPVTASLNASVIDVYPSLAEAMRDSGWEFMGHGIHQRSVGAEGDETSFVSEALARLEKFTSIRPRGWLGPGLSETFDTPDILKANGIEYVCEWVLDDLPCLLETMHGPLVTVPYNLELNDSVVFAVEKHSSAEAYQRVEETMKCFLKEIRETGQPRVLAIPLHPHLSGVPHRIGYVERALDMLLEQPETVFMNGSQILDWFLDQLSDDVWPRDEVSQEHAGAK